MEMIDLDPVINGESEELHDMITRHYAFTGSTVAKFILDDFENQLRNFVKVYPKDYKKAVQKAKLKVEGR
jgi:glutamate synthase (NADPH/NADH) large chain